MAVLGKERIQSPLEGEAVLVKTQRPGTTGGWVGSKNSRG